MDSQQELPNGNLAIKKFYALYSILLSVLIFGVGFFLVVQSPGDAIAVIILAPLLPTVIIPLVVSIWSIIVGLKVYGGSVQKYQELWPIHLLFALFGFVYSGHAILDGVRSDNLLWVVIVSTLALLSLGYFFTLVGPRSNQSDSLAR